jgi:cell division protein FtsB
MMSKKIVIRAFFVVEIVFFVTLYFVSPDGLMAVKTRKIENKQLADAIQQTKEEIAKLERETKEWETNPFYPEKVAREQLQMARPDDEVYYV